MVDVESNRSDMEILHSVIWPNTENKSHISWIYIFQKPTQGLLMAMYLGIQCGRRAVCSLPFYLLVYYLISQFFTYLSNVPLALQHCISQLMAAQPVMLPDLWHQKHCQSALRHSPYLLVHNFFASLCSVIELFTIGKATIKSWRHFFFFLRIQFLSFLKEIDLSICEIVNIEIFFVITR